MDKTNSLTLTLNRPLVDYEVRTVKRWAVDSIMIADTYDVLQRGNVGQFQVVSTFITDSQLHWVGQWSANANFSVMNHADIFKLANMQLLNFGYPFGLSEAVILGLRDVILPDGYTLRSKMNWLYNNIDIAGAKPNSELWGHGDWEVATEIRMMGGVNGGQPVAVSRELMTLNGIPMRKLMAFRRADFGKRVPYIFQHATVAAKDSNAYGDYPRGYITVPVALDPQDFNFTGLFPAAFHWLPEKWLVSPERSLL